MALTLVMAAVDVVRTMQSDQVNQLIFAIPGHCVILSGRQITVRIEVGNLMDSTITRDLPHYVFLRSPSS